MRNRVFEIVVFLIDYMQGSAGRFSGADEVWDVLEAQGYSDDEISSAYSWFLKRLDNAPQQFFSAFPKQHSSNRILNPLERGLMSTAAHGFLLKLLSLSLISDEQLEAILDRLSAYGPKPATLEHIKLIASSVVFSDLSETDALAMFDGKSGRSHFVN